MGIYIYIFRCLEDLKDIYDSFDMEDNSIKPVDIDAKTVGRNLMWEGYSQFNDYDVEMAGNIRNALIETMQSKGHNYGLPTMFGKRKLLDLIKVRDELKDEKDRDLIESDNDFDNDDDDDE